jgi:hypothetical protein
MTLVSGTAKILSLRYPCGPTCTAETWLIEIDGKTTYLPVNLPDEFKIPRLSVNATLKKTGVLLSLPTGNNPEKVELISIALPG